MAEVTVFTFEHSGNLGDPDIGLDLPCAMSVEAQRTTGIAPRHDDFAVRRVAVLQAPPPEGVSGPAWAAFTARLECVINQRITASPGMQERMEAMARQAWACGGAAIKTTGIYP